MNNGDDTMYDYIKGTITYIKNNAIVVDNNGIGYLVYVANPYSYEIGKEYKVYIYQHIMEDENSLYGFKTLEEKENRLHRLNEVVNKYFLENNQKLVGKTVKVLVEGNNTNGKDGMYGYTDTMKLINFDGCSNLTGKIIDVKVTSAKTWSLDGEINE